MFETLIDIFYDSIKDALVILPFLFLVYALMEAIESAKRKEKIERALSGKYAPIFASLSGIVPECGFSVMCAKLFDGGFIAIGTLVAAFVATSDEGVIILLSGGNSVGYAVILVIFKIVYAVFLGVVLNMAFKKLNRHVCPVKGDCIECGERHEEFFDKFIAHPFYHAAKTFLYVLAANIVLNSVFESVGEERVYSFISSGRFYEPVFTALFGLIPNCASSVFLAQGFISGVISFSGLIAGLTANSGVGMLLLFKNRKNTGRNLLVILIMFCAGALIGFISLPIR